VGPQLELTVKYYRALNVPPPISNLFENHWIKNSVVRFFQRGATPKISEERNSSSRFITMRRKKGTSEKFFF